MNIVVTIFSLSTIIVSFIIAFALAKVSSMCSRAEEEQEKEYINRKEG